MTRDQIIADLALHGYVPYVDPWDWVAIWNGETGRMCKFFEDTEDGPRWDVRGPLISILAMAQKVEVPWHRISDEQLAMLTSPEMPPKVRHRVPRSPDDPFGQRGFVDL